MRLTTENSDGQRLQTFPISGQCNGVTKKPVLQQRVLMAKLRRRWREEDADKQKVKFD